MTKSIKHYGTWTSPLTAEDVAGAALRFGLVRADALGTIYWSEGRPAEKGRCVIMRKTVDGEPEDLLPPPLSARSRVHEYGGGEFSVAGEDVYFVNNEDQDIYRLTADAVPECVTSEPKIRFADIVFDETHNRLIAVGEREVDGDHAHPENFLAAINLTQEPGSNVSPLIEGHDFFAAPAIDPDGEKLAWLAWDLPDMPWDSATLYVASFNQDGSLESASRVAGDANSATFQPSWTADGTLVFVWDKTGFANLYAYDGEKVSAIASQDADFSRPLWTFGMRSYANHSGGITAACFKEGQVELENLGGKQWSASNELRSIETLVATPQGFAALAATDTSPPAVMSIQEQGIATVRTSGASNLSQNDISAGQPITFENRDGEKVYGLYYPPTNATTEGPEGDKPPILFTVHGGPTGMGDRGLKMKTQYWTNRGFGVFDTDYSGSTGYGRAYIERLNGLWGIKDVSDIADAAVHMVAEGYADENKLFITGSSAGGMTVLLALADHDIFSGGTCTYGVTDLAHLLKFTHKFEAGYLYRLLGIAPGDDTSSTMMERSPITKAEKIDRPVIFFQGLEDKVVPPEQSRSMVDALKRNGTPVEYVEFEGEAHGFRQASTIKTVLEREYAFYANLLGITPPQT